ncbi:transmembrane protein [Heterostelium album PN500]|uniref:Transmembrane protein n=1 Tax=Heterostelium pallidum (strain ATCC 26659 / Pp 5 / PN500) TaxID=670386 RepID=D3BUR4_HETP5|nr:transmembrane protein [Heterostelium album PN500]EFA74852.1 transmembrane protein [Heterostelium album PN500]|eukprot:XP_020426986.1 transmembrane protein [Heterostelium album PN500]
MSSVSPQIPINTNNSSSTKTNVKSSSTVNNSNIDSKEPSNYQVITGFLSGSLASMVATTFTNPIELVKTRLQLQGELKMSARVYTGIGDAFIKIWKAEGLIGMQRGLFPAYLSQGTLNGCRLGSYDAIKRLIGADPEKENYFIKNLAAGALAGAFGASMGSPFDLVKVRMQAARMFPNDPQFSNYTSTSRAFAQIIRTEGFRGLTRGMATSAQRTAVGSSIQLSTYFETKRFIINKTGMEDDIYAHLLSSLVAGLFVTVGMNPFDVARTRLYYQGQGNTHGEKYKSLMDCIYKTVKVEGFFALYKGFLAHYLRLGPHTIFTLVFWEQFKMVFAKFENKFN